MVAVAATVGSTGVASAAVVVPPGQAGSTCSEYHFETPQRYWQTCAWADYRYVWFTVNFGNSGSTTWYPELTYIDYIKAGVRKTCAAGAEHQFQVVAHSTRGTDRMDCVLTRVPGAFASVGRVQNLPGGALVEQHSPTLQVQ
jgi:hypothetical protein